MLGHAARSYFGSNKVDHADPSRRLTSELACSHAHREQSKLALIGHSLRFAFAPGASAQKQTSARSDIKCDEDGKMLSLLASGTVTPTRPQCKRDAQLVGAK